MSAPQLPTKKLPGKNLRVLAMAHRYVRWRIGRDLEGLWVSGLDHVRPWFDREPLVLAINHVSWWDPMVLVALDHLMGTESYALMDRRNMERMPYFGWLGAVPLDRRDTELAKADVDAAAAMLDRPNRTMWIFPQGRQRPAHLRPFDLRPGVRHLVEKSGKPVVAVSLTYAFREAERPAALVRFGAVRPGSEPADGVLPWLECALDEGLAHIDRFLDTGEGDFEPVIAPRAADSQDGMAARMLGWFGTSTAGGQRA